jgi:hypothetical protein
MKLDYNKHYINKSKTKHYYMGHIFDNFEWSEVIHGIRVQNFIIGQSSKYRIIPNTCERWYNQDNNSTNIAKPCKNKPYYRSSSGPYFCKSCAREVNKINPTVTFNKILPH